MRKIQRTKPPKNYRIGQPRRPTGKTVRKKLSKKPGPKRQPPKRPTVIRKSDSQGFSFFPQAFASSTPSTAGKFNPPGWTGQQDYGTPGFSTQSKKGGISPTNRVSDSWHMTQQGDLGAAIASSKKANPKQWKKVIRKQQLRQIGHSLSQINPDTGRPYNDPPSGQVGVYFRWAPDDPNRPAGVHVQSMDEYNQYMSGVPAATQVVQKTAMTGERILKAKTGATTWYATNAQGQTVKGEGKLSLQARQFYGDRGYTLITSKPPKAPLHQQRLSDETGITTYTPVSYTHLTLPTKA